MVEEILGDGRVDGVRVRDLTTDELSTLPVAGVFVHVGRLPNTALLDGVVALTDAGHVPTDIWMRTELPGLFATGRRTRECSRPGDQCCRRRGHRGDCGAPVPSGALLVRAWRLSDSFGIDRLALEEQPDPPLGRGRARVRVRAVSLNYRDVAMVEHGIPLAVCNCRCFRARMPPARSSRSAPRSLASRSEIVLRPRSSSAGSMATRRCPPPTARCWPAGSTACSPTTIVVDADGLVHVPQHLSDEEVSTLPCAAVTAWHALVDQGSSARRGETILVQGTGGVAIFALQFGLMVGGRVIATS